MFFRRCKARKSQSTLLRLIDGEGRALEEPEEIKDHIVGFYADLLGSTGEVSDLPIPDGQVVHADEMGELLRSPSVEDIRNVVFSIGVNKYPGT